VRMPVRTGAHDDHLRSAVASGLYAFQIDT